MWSTWKNVEFDFMSLSSNDTIKSIGKFNDAFIKSNWKKLTLVL